MPRSERICKHCNLNLIENEFHFLLLCSLYEPERKTFDHIHIINSYYMSLCAHDKALWLLSQEDNNILSAVGTYINCCFEKRIKDVTITSNKE